MPKRRRKKDCEDRRRPRTRASCVRKHVIPQELGNEEKWHYPERSPSPEVAFSQPHMNQNKTTDHQSHPSGGDRNISVLSVNILLITEHDKKVGQSGC
jgi:hypothetical protein